MAELVINDSCQQYQPSEIESVPEDYQIYLITLYTITSLIALIGNMTVIVVEIFGQNSAKNFRKFLINLAISDIIFAVLCVPFTYTDFMYGHWKFPHWLCPVAQFVQLLSVFVTVFTLTVIGIERFIATIIPFSKTYDWLIEHTNILLLTGWILGCLFGSLWMPYTMIELVQFSNNQSYFDCTFKPPVNETIFNGEFYVQFNFILTFMLPLITLIICYGAISVKLIKDQMDKPEAFLRRNRHGNHQDRRSRTIKMMFAVVFLYNLCWLPIKIYQLLRDTKEEWFEVCSSKVYYKLVGIYFFCHWMAMSHSFVNPIIYSFMSQTFRADFIRILNKVPMITKFNFSTASIGNPTVESKL